MFFTSSGDCDAGAEALVPEPADRSFKTVCACSGVSFCELSSFCERLFNMSRTCSVVRLPVSGTVACLDLYMKYAASAIAMTINITKNALLLFLGDVVFVSILKKLFLILKANKQDYYTTERAT